MPGGPVAGTLRAHLARANPQLGELAAVAECVVVFQGPQTYISPSLYPDQAPAPERSLPSVELTSRCTRGAGRKLIDDAAWLRRQVDDLHGARRRPPPRALVRLRRARAVWLAQVEGHRRDRNSHRAHRRQMEGEPEAVRPSIKPASLRACIAVTATTRSWRRWSRSAARTPSSPAPPLPPLRTSSRIPPARGSGLHGDLRRVEGEVGDFHRGVRRPRRGARKAARMVAASASRAIVPVMSASDFMLQLCGHALSGVSMIARARSSA